MGAPSASAAVDGISPPSGPAPAYGKTPRTSKADRPWASRPGFRAIPLAKIGCIRHGERYGNYTVMTTADDPGGRHWTTGGHVHAGRRHWPYAACHVGRRLTASQTVTSELRAQPGEAQPGEAWVRDEGRRASES